MSHTVSIIGAGRIGSAVIRHVEQAPSLCLGRVLTRSGSPDTADPDAFLAEPADIIIDAAGPESLRRHGAACLARAELWSVGGAALVDTDLLTTLRETASRAGTRLRLFAPWAYGIGTVPPAAVSALTLRILRTGGPTWSGPLDEAARLFPDMVNFAVSAALAGPGIAATRVEFASDPPGTHRIEALCETEAGTYRAAVDLSLRDRHPTALSLIAALEALSSPVTYG